MIGRFAANLLRRHIADSAQHLPGFSFGGGYAADGFGESLRAAKFGQAEIENFQATVARNENVFRLEVAVNNPLLVQGGETVGELRGNVLWLCGPACRLKECLAESFAFEEFGNDVVDACSLADVVNPDDVGMIQSGDGTSLLFEAAKAIGIIDKGRGKSLEGNVALQSSVASAIGFAHGSSTDGRDDFIRA